MRRLILLRHAKSSWATPGQPDHERPLNGRGRRSAKAVGEWLEASGYRPGEVLCSTSVRTRETWARVAKALTDPPAPSFLDALYLAGPEEILDCLARAQASCVMVIAHNPGMAALATGLVSAAPAHSKFAQFPTAATLVCDIGIDDWAALRPGTGRVVDFIVPRELTA